MLASPGGLVQTESAGLTHRVVDSVVGVGPGNLHLLIPSRHCRKVSRGNLKTTA